MDLDETDSSSDSETFVVIPKSPSGPSGLKKITSLLTPPSKKKEPKNNDGKLRSSAGSSASTSVATSPALEVKKASGDKSDKPKHKEDVKKEEKKEEKRDEKKDEKEVKKDEKSRGDKSDRSDQSDATDKEEKKDDKRIKVSVKKDKDDKKAHRRRSLPRQSSKSSLPSLTASGPSSPAQPEDPKNVRESRQSRMERLIKSEDNERRMYQKTPSLLNEPSHSPRIISAGIPPRLGDSRLKFQSSSTATVHLASTIDSPDVTEIVQCMAVSLNGAMREFDKRVHAGLMYPSYNMIWNEQFHPIDHEADLTNVPTVEQIHAFLAKIFTRSDLSAECGVMAMCYIDRLVTLSGMFLLPSNYRRIILSAIILAAKIWEELAVWNVDFKKVFPLVEVDDLAKMEKELLTVLQFTVTLKASVYAKYYYALRGLSTKDPAHFPLKPLDEKDQIKLEERSRGLDKPRRHGPQPKEKPRIKRTVSADSYEMRPKRVILS